MMRSLSSAVAGLRTHQTKMDVIGNNIANVNTYGFKASRTTFSDVYYQSLGSGAGPTTAVGGTNPTQIGYGSSVATIDVLNTQAGAASTDRPMDVYITADGFLVSKDAAGNLSFTRLGNLAFDREGNLCDALGNFIQGFPLDASGQPVISADGSIERDQVQNINVDPDLLDQLTGIQITAGGQIIGILPGEQKISLSTAAPEWINADSATIPENSNITGPIRLKVRGQFDPGAFQSAINELGIGSISIGDMEFSDSLCLEKKDLSVTASSDGKITVKGYYINEQGKRTQMTAVANIPNGSTNIDRLEFKHNGKVVFTATDVNAADLMFPDKVAYTGGTGEYSSDIPGTTANLASAFTSAGYTDVTNATLANETGGALSGLKITADKDGKITLSGNRNGVAFGPVNADADYVSEDDQQLLFVTDNGNITIDLKAKIPAGTYTSGSGSYASPVGPRSTNVADAFKQTGYNVISANLTSENTGALSGLKVETKADGTVSISGNLGGAPFGPIAATPPFDKDNSGKQTLTFAHADGDITIDLTATIPTEVPYTYDDVAMEDSVTYYYQGTWRDKGDNTLYTDNPADPGKPGWQALSTSANSIFSFGDVAITYDGTKAPGAFNGVIATAETSSGERIDIGCIVLARFRNAAGLEEDGNSKFVESLNSGDAMFGKPGSAGFGALKSNYLEMSNVDVAKEFTDMITTQRGFQANTRIVTVSDEMLQELVNLKR